MNIHTPQTELERQQATYKAVRARLNTPPSHCPPTEETAPDEPVEPFIPTWRDASPKDAHVQAWQMWKIERHSRSRNHVKDRCKELGIDHALLLSGAKWRSLVGIRDKLMWEIKYEIDPSISWAKLGRLFKRDHSSAFYSVYRHLAKLGDVNAIAAVQKKYIGQKERHSRLQAERKCGQ